MSAVPQPSEHVEVEESRPCVIALVRVSTAEQAAEGRAGIPRQEAAIKAIIARENLKCIETIHIIDVSGSDVRRAPQMVRTLHMLETGQISGVVCDALDRLFRPTQFEDFALLQPFQTHKAKIWTSAQTFDPGSLNGILLSGIHAVLAGNELATIRARVDGAKEAKRRQGRCPSSPQTLPLGVSVNPDTRELYYNDQIALVREMFRLFAEEGIWNYSEIQRRTGIGHMTVRNILKNPIYTGWRVYSQKRGKKLVSRTGKTYRQKEDRPLEDVIRVKVLDPIVSEETFERVQRLVAQTRYNHVERRKAREHCHLGTGIAHCGYCDSPLYCPSKRVEGGRRGYYTCKRNYYVYRPKTDGCPQCNLRESDVDRAIYDFTLHTLLDAERLTRILETAIQRMREVVQPFPAALDPDAEIAKLHRQDKRLMDAYALEAISVEELREKRKEIASRVARLKLVARPQEATPQFDVEALVRRVVGGVGALPLVSDSYKRKEIVHALFSELRIKDKAIVGFRLHEDFAVPGVAGGNVQVSLETPFQICAEPEVLPDGQKRCSACNEIQPNENFHPRKSQCRTCVAIRSHERYLRRKAQRARQAK